MPGPCLTIARMPGHGTLGIHDGMLRQSFQIELAAHTLDDTDINEKAFATIFFPEPVILTKLAGGLAALASVTCEACNGIDDSMCLAECRSSGCMDWCSQWTCSSADCALCGVEHGCARPPPPPTPSPSPSVPGELGVTLSLMSVNEWRQLLEGERQSALKNEVNEFGMEYTWMDWDAVPDSVTKEQDVLIPASGEHTSKTDSVAIVELQGYRVRPIAITPRNKWGGGGMEDATSVRPLLPEIICHAAESDFVAFVASGGRQQTKHRSPPFPPPPFPHGECGIICPAPFPSPRASPMHTSPPHAAILGNQACRHHQNLR